MIDDWVGRHCVYSRESSRQFFIVVALRRLQRDLDQRRPETIAVPADIVRTQVVTGGMTAYPTDYEAYSRVIKVSLGTIARVIMCVEFPWIMLLARKDVEKCACE